MVGAGAGTGLLRTPTGCSCSIRFVSCIAFPPEKKSGEPADELSLPLSRVVVPLPAVRRPTSSDVFVCAIGQLHDCGVQAARTNPLVMRSRNQSWSTLRRSMSVGCSRMKRRTSFSWIR